MNAERLRQIVETDGWPPYGLLQAVPEIIAVVKAAEEGVDESLADEFGRLRPILDALAALDAKISKEAVA